MAAHGRKALAYGLWMLVVGAAALGGARAAHDVALFELDRNVADGPATGKDWENVFLGPVGVVSAFVHDEANPDTTYHDGGNKDTTDVGGWRCISRPNPGDKLDFLHAYAALVEGPDGSDAGTDPDLYLFFGAERYDASGAANVGMWVLQQEVGCDPAGTGNFTGTHADGDLLVVSEFTNGGAVAEFKIYRWNGGAGGSLGATPVFAGSDCISGAGPGDLACGTVNEATVATPWATQTKTGAADTLPPGHLFEGGLNLHSFFPDADKFRCFANVLMQSRSAPSLTSSLSDFSLLRLATCDARISIAPPASTQPVGAQQPLTVLVERNAGSGWGPAPGAAVAGSIASGPGSFVGGSGCVTGATGQCTLTVTSQVSGTSVVRAASDVPVGSTTLHRATDGTGGNSGPASVTWTRVAASLATQSSPTGANVPPGTSATDTATLGGAAGLPAPGGTVTFFLCQPSEVTAGSGCLAPSGTQVGGPVAVAGGSATSAPAAATALGTHCWRAAYSGDATYLHATHTDFAAECFTVERQPAGVATTSIPSGTGIEPGTAVGDTATVSGGPGQPVPTGSVAFFLCQPAEVTPGTGCVAPAGSQVGAPAALSGGVATSASTTATSTPGTYCWRAAYGGDGYYLPATHTDFAAECFFVKQPSTTTTAPSAASIVLGGPASDHATVSGGGATPTGSVTFHVCAPAQLTGGVCSTGGAALGTVALVNGQATSASFAPDHAGTWCFRGTYNGDANYQPSSDFSPNECFQVTKGPSTTLTTPSAASVAVGGSISDHATVTGPGVTPTGSVTFHVCAPAQLTGGVCSTGGAALGTVTLNNGQATSASFAPDHAGTWCFRGTYNGDANYQPSSDFAANECFEVTKGPSTTLTTPSAASVPVGGAIQDHAAVSGPGITPTGSMAFHVCAPAQLTGGVCSTGGTPLGTVALVNGQATSASYTPDHAGTWCFRGTYSGDVNYHASSDASPGECFTVTKASSATVTMPNPTSFVLGGSVSDSATVTGPGVPPMGTVTFHVCAPAQLTGGVCSTGGTPLGTVALVNGQATSPAYTPDHAGTWCFRGTYSGDANYHASSDSSPGECFTVAKAAVLLGTTASPQGPGVAPATPAKDTAHLQGPPGVQAPTGTVTFYLCQPGETTAAGCEAPQGAQVGAPVAVAGGSATSAATQGTLAIGTYCWRAAYGGDANYEPAVHTDATAECFTTVRQAPSIATLSKPQGSVLRGTPATDNVTVAGSHPAWPVPTGIATFFICVPGETTPAGCPAGGAAVGAAKALAAGKATSDAFADTMPEGTYCWRAEYGGDGFYLPASHTNNSTECFTSAKQLPAISTLSSPTGSGWSPGTQARDDAVVAGVAGGPVPTGTVAFHVCRPGQGDGTGCPSGGAFVGQGTLAQGQASSPLFDQTMSLGRYCWRAEYGGDAFYLPSKHTNAGSECFTVVDGGTCGLAQDELCAFGESACVAVAVHVRADPKAAPALANLSFAATRAEAHPGMAHAEGSSAVAEAAALGGLVRGAGLSARCVADHGATAVGACGDARAGRVDIDLRPLGIPVELHTSPVHQAGCTHQPGPGYNVANATEVWGKAYGLTINANLTEPYARVELPHGMLLMAHERTKSAVGSCLRHSGNALRLTMPYEPGSAPSDAALEIIVGRVSTIACPPPPPAPAAPGPESSPQEPCPQGEDTPWCAPAPAGCVAMGAYVRGAADDDRLRANLTLAAARAHAQPVSGTATAREHLLDVSPGLFRATAVAADCEASTEGGSTSACGEAGMLNLSMDLAALGVPLQLRAESLTARACAAQPGGGDAAGMVHNLTGSLAGVPLALEHNPGPNEVVPLQVGGASVGYIALNERFAPSGPCDARAGHALRVVLYRPGTVQPATELVVGSVSVKAC